MIHTQPHQLRNGIDPVIRTLLDIIEQLLLRHILGIEFLQMNMILAVLQGTDCLQQTFFHGPSDTHGLTGRFHLGRQDIRSVRELIKWKSRHLRNYIIQCRFKACRRVCQLYLI